MRGDQVALGNGALDVEAQLGKLLYEALYELDERFESVGGLGVVCLIESAGARKFSG